MSLLNERSPQWQGYLSFLTHCDASNRLREATRIANADAAAVVADLTKRLEAAHSEIALLKTDARRQSDQLAREGTELTLLRESLEETEAELNDVRGIQAELVGKVEPTRRLITARAALQRIVNRARGIIRCPLCYNVQEEDGHTDNCPVAIAQDALKVT